MTVHEVMTHAPACATTEMGLQEVARMMVDNNCGCIPVLDEAGAPIGVITDRDIVCRTVALGYNPIEKTVADAMTDACISVKKEATIQEVSDLLQRNQIRRAVVVDEGRVVGMVSLADIARRSETLAGELAAAVSEPSLGPSSIH
ncbi:MAG TPA: CBS domain-containing protein [Kofleriaceae bacterium]|nr:CBS domain-containing protein [Kofleriaceae bacterium]